MSVILPFYDPRSPGPFLERLINHRRSRCKAIVELAHHCFLRHPNMKRFAPVLEKVGKLSKDPAVVQRAKRYRLGL